VFLADSQIVDDLLLLLLLIIFVVLGYGAPLPSPVPTVAIIKRVNPEL